MEPSEAASTIPELFYDLLSILMPGLYLLIAMFFAAPTIVSELTREGVIHPSVTALILAYLLGYMLYSLSSLLVAKPFNSLLGQPADFLLLGDPDGRYLRRHQRLFLGVPLSPDYLLRGVQRGLRILLADPRFKVTHSNIHEVYELCRNHVMDRTVRRSVAIRKEQAYGEMARAVVLISSVLLVALPVTRLFAGFPSKWFLLQMCGHAVFLIAFAFRYAQARLIGPYHIYSTFSTIASIAELEAKTPTTTPPGGN